jgi:TolA-binding protein
VAAGHWDDLLAQVDRTGIAPALENASSEDLLALADAARYRRRNGLAREALLAERRRFPGSARALDAAFLLGRLAETTEALSTALPWYDEYLRRAPAGTYASEALGRKMIATERLEGTASAQTIASEYLLRFPHGAYAGSARALLRHGQ